MNTVDYEGAASIFPTPQFIECRICHEDIDLKRDEWTHIPKGRYWLIVHKRCLDYSLKAGEIVSRLYPSTKEEITDEQELTHTIQE